MGPDGKAPAGGSLCARLRRAEKASEAGMLSGGASARGAGFRGPLVERSAPGLADVGVLRMPLMLDGAVERSGSVGGRVEAGGP